VPHATAYSYRHFFSSANLARGRSLAWVSAQLGHSRITTTLNSYTDNIQDAERPGDALVAELLSGDKSGTVALREGPRVSADVREVVAQMPTGSENV